jgi:hypothetical protein
VVLFQKNFKGYIFCFLGDSVGRYIFEQFAHETNLKKKRSVMPVQSAQNQLKSQIMFLKNSSPRDLYTMTLDVAFAV